MVSLQCGLEHRELVMKSRKYNTRNVVSTDKKMFPKNDESHEGGSRAENTYKDES